MFKGFKDILTFMHPFFSVLVQCNTSLAQAVTSQAENKEPWKRVFIVIIPKYLFETNGFRIDWDNLIEEIYIITDKLGFGISACDVTGSFTSLLTR